MSAGSKRSSPALDDVRSSAWAHLVRLKPDVLPQLVEVYAMHPYEVWPLVPRMRALIPERERERIEGENRIRHALDSLERDLRLERLYEHLGRLARAKSTAGRKAERAAILEDVERLEQEEAGEIERQLVGTVRLSPEAAEDVLARANALLRDQRKA